MPRTSRKAQAEEINTRLTTEYPDATCALVFDTPLQLLVATVLSAQCTDARVNMVTPALFEKYPDARAFAEADQEELEQAIRSTGFFRNKAKNIRQCCVDISATHDGEVPRSMQELTPLAGIGRKTANVILGNAYAINEGIAVDTHVGRLAQRLGLTTEKDPVKVEVDLVKLFPRDEWTIVVHRIIAHGRGVCRARKPDCEHCFLSDICPSTTA